MNTKISILCLCIFFIAVTLVQGEEATPAGISEEQHSISIQGTAQGGTITIGLTDHPTIPPIIITTQSGQTSEQIVSLFTQSSPAGGLRSLIVDPVKPNALVSRTHPGGIYMHSTDPGIPDRPGINNLQASIVGTSVVLTWQNPAPTPEYIYITTGSGGQYFIKGSENKFIADSSDSHDKFYRTIQYSVVCLYLDGSVNNDNPTFSVSDVVKSQVLQNPRFKKITDK